MTDRFDVIVIGAGHAGCEAAFAAARLGVRVGLCTLSTDTVAHMPCNPAIGGTAKGHLVREIDALGGLMGAAIDATGIQFKLLNRSRGPAVWSPRAQADKKLYGAWVKHALDREPNIEWIIGRAGRILVENGHVTGLAMEEGDAYGCDGLIVTTGTFLNGLIHIGAEQQPAGRAGEPPSRELAASLKSFGFAWGRLKTGTPPRLDRESIAFDRRVADGTFHVEHGDDPPVPFSFLTANLARDQIVCHLIHTTERVHDLVKENVGRSPLFNGQIQGIGPRYCPSLEDKIVRFPEKDRHQIFLEPEGLDAREIYVNGFSTSLPRDVQADLVHALPGLEDAVLLRPGYAVEYDFIQPTELTRQLETKRIHGLFFAGQVNGTSGYEEAAAQGIVAGINAARQVRGDDGFELRPRRGVHRDPRGRPDYEGLSRALSDVHVPGRASPAPPNRQRRPAVDAARPRCRPRERRAVGAVLASVGAGSNEISAALDATLVRSAGGRFGARKPVAQATGSSAHRPGQFGPGDARHRCPQAGDRPCERRDHRQVCRVSPAAGSRD